jgi:hypothetical protein
VNCCCLGIAKSTFVCVLVRACMGRVCMHMIVGVGARALVCACARVALLVQHATRRHIAICGLSRTTIFVDITS